MKNMIKKIIQQTIYMFVVGIALLFVSCDSYLDVDTDADAPTVAPVNQLLANVQLSVKNNGDFRLYSGNILGTYMHQFCFREEQDQYDAKPSNGLMNNEWNNTYLALNDIQSLISTAELQGHTRYVGIAQILKAYIMHVTVDVWGDVPYSEATKLEAGIVGAKFDNQKEIYKDIFALIDKGKANINLAKGRTVGTDDLFYAGNMPRWIKFANTLKFKLYNQVRLTDVFVQADFNSLVAENNFFTTNADDFQFNHTINMAPTDERHNLYRGAYGGTQVAYYSSPWFYEILRGWNPSIHNGNPDPRIPYYMYNQLRANQNPENFQVSNGDPRADYWDRSTGYFTIRFGSIGKDKGLSVEGSATFPGIFVSGGRYDDGLGGKATINSSTGRAPKRMLTYDEYLYIRAELMHNGIIAGSTIDALKLAVNASFAKVDQVVTNSGNTQNAPKLVGNALVTTFVTKLETEFNAASPAKKLEIIMTQKWVATFGDHLDQYNDYRRTGYPILANPTSTTKEYQLVTSNPLFPINDETTVLNNPYPQSIFWPQNELNLNKQAPAQKVQGTYKLFWAK